MSFRPAPDTTARTRSGTRFEKVLNAGLSFSCAYGVDTDAPKRGRAEFEDQKLFNGHAMANRANSEHRAAIAVLAYQNMWNGFINNRLRQIPPVKFPPGKAIGYAPIFAFFAQIGTLKKFLLPEDASEFSYPPESSINVVLRDVSSASELNRACELELDIDGKFPYESLNVAVQIAETIIEPAGLGDEEAVKIWDIVIDSLIENLKDAATAIDKDATLFRGMNINHKLYSTPGMYSNKSNEFSKRLVEDMSNVFVSASKSEDVAAHFTEINKTHVDDRWFFEMEIKKGTFVIDVDGVLPKSWRCFVGEEEVILAFGNIYTWKNVIRLFEGFKVDMEVAPRLVNID
jgi:hypothetical protein